MIKNWRYKPNKCGNCGQTGHITMECQNDPYCVKCQQFGHKSGFRSLQCKHVMAMAVASKSFGYFFDNCLNYNQDILPPPRVGEEFGYNIPWRQSHVMDRRTHSWSSIPN